MTECSIEWKRPLKPVIVYFQTIAVGEMFRVDGDEVYPLVYDLKLDYVYEGGI